MLRGKDMRRGEALITVGGVWGEARERDKEGNGVETEGEVAQKKRLRSTPGILKKRNSKRKGRSFSSLSQRCLGVF